MHFIRLGFDGDAPVYRCRLSRVHDLNRCEVSVTIPFDPVRLWSGSVIDSEPDTGIEMMAHIALTSLCEDHLTATAALPITLLPIWDQGMPTRVASGRFKLLRVRLRTGIPRLRMPMDGIPF
jgi:hypothetical protein